LTATGYAVQVTAAPDAAQNAMWAGADVYVSSSATGGFDRYGTLNGPGTAGLTTTFLAADPTINPDGSPDYQGAATVNVTVRDSTFYNALAGATIAEAEVGATLCVIGTEVCSYITATLLSTDADGVATYQLTGLFRNWYGTGGTDIPVGSRFMRLQ